MSKGLSFRGARQSALRTLALWVAQIALVLYFLYCVQAASYMRGKADGLAEAPPASTASSLQEATIADAPGQAMVSMTDEEHEALVAASKTPKGLKKEDQKLLQRMLRDAEAELALYQDEIPPTFMKKTISTPFHGEVTDTHQEVNAKCPRYVTMMKPTHGLGHQMGTFTTAMITALFFDLTYVDAPYSDKSIHGDYPGIGEFTGLSEGELQLADVRAKVAKVIEVDEMPVEPTSPELPKLYEPLRQAFEEKYKDECNVLFKLREYYSYDYGTYTKEIVSRKFREAPHRKPISLLYDPKEFIIAVHIRVGDITPTNEDYFLKVLSQALPALEDTRTPYRVHVFAEKKGAGDYGKLVELVGKELIAFHPDMAPFETFYHLTQAHVFVMSASGFSQFPAVAGTKALVFSPPSREAFPLKFCPPFSVCCLKDGTFELDGLVRLRWRVERWSKTQRLEKDVVDLKAVLSSSGKATQ